MDGELDDSVRSSRFSPLVRGRVKALVVPKFESYSDAVSGNQTEQYVKETKRVRLKRMVEEMGDNKENVVAPAGGSSEEQIATRKWLRFIGEKVEGKVASREFEQIIKVCLSEPDRFIAKLAMLLAGVEIGCSVSDIVTDVLNNWKPTITVEHVSKWWKEQNPEFVDEELVDTGDVQIGHYQVVMNNPEETGLTGEIRYINSRFQTSDGWKFKRFYSNCKGVKKDFGLLRAVFKNSLSMANDALLKQHHQIEQEMWAKEKRNLLENIVYNRKRRIHEVETALERVMGHVCTLGFCPEIDEDHDCGHSEVVLSHILLMEHVLEPLFCSHAGNCGKWCSNRMIFSRLCKELQGSAKRAFMLVMARHLRDVNMAVLSQSPESGFAQPVTIRKRSAKTHVKAFVSAMEELDYQDLDPEITKLVLDLKRLEPTMVPYEIPVENRAQMPVASVMMNALWSFLSRSVTQVLNASSVVLSEVSVWIKLIFDKIKLFVGSSFEYIQENLNTRMTLMLSDILKEWWHYIGKDRLIKIVLALLGAGLCLSGYLTMNTVWAWLRSGVGSGMCAQGATIDTPAGAVITILMMVFSGVSGSTKFITKMRNVVAIAQGSTAMATLATAIITLLPYSLRRGCIELFGSESQRNSLYVSSWVQKASSIMSMSESTEFVANRRYQQIVKDLVQEGTANNVMAVPNHSNIAGLYSSLLTLHTRLNAASADAVRVPPYSIHLCGGAGTGKSRIAPMICRELESSETIYFIPKSFDGFWNGFFNQKSLIWDEFGTTSADIDINGSLAGVYLDLVSTSTFRPNLASINDVLTGRKGVTATPKVLVTISNRFDPIPSSLMDLEAYNRRRNVVIRLERKDGQKGNIDLSKYSDQDKDQWSMVKFTVHRDCFPVYTGTFKQVVAFLKKDREDFLAGFSHIPQATEIQDIDTVLDNMMLVGEGMVDGSMHSFFAQGKSAQRKKNQKKKKVEASANEWSCSEAGESYASCDEREKSLTELELLDRLTDEITPEEELELATILEESEEHQDLSPEVVREIEFTGRDISLYQWLQRIEWRKRKDETIERAKKVLDSMGLLKIVALGFSVAAFLIWVGGSIGRALAGGGDEYDEIGELSFAQSNERSVRAKRKNNRNGFAQYSGQGSKHHAAVTFLVKGRCVKGFGIQGRRFATYTHAFMGLQNELDGDGLCCKIYVHDRNVPIIIRRNMLVDNGEDLMVINLDSFTQVPKVANCLPGFATYEEMQAIPQMKGLFARECAELCDVKMSSGTYRADTVTESGEDRFEKIVLEEAWLYNALTESGECGTLLKAASGALNGQIIGMHVAGNCDPTNPKAFATLCIREELQRAMDHFDKQLIVKDIPGGHGDLRSQGIMDGFGFEEELVDVEFEEPGLESLEEIGGGFLETAQQEISLLANCKSVELVSRDEVVHIPNKTKIRKSIIAEHLPWSVDSKVVPILSHRDERAKGVDPVVNVIKDTCDSEQKRVEQHVVDAIYDTIADNLKKNLKPVKWRKLTIDEACSGVPGVLPSMNIKTSAGWPAVKWIKKQGKFDFLDYDNGNIIPTPVLRQAVKEFMATWEADGEMDSRFLGFFKDELVTQNKVDNVNTRVIYCGDVVANVAFRMKYGFLLAMFNNSALTVAASIGINQFSWDMDCLYDCFVAASSKNFVAGDYKSFDKRMQLQFRTAAYSTLATVGEVTGKEWDWFVRQQTQSPAQMGRFKFETHSNNYSGVFFTTIVNCLVNEGYMRYAFFRLCPGKFFDSNVVMKCLGDDHVLAVSDHVSNFDGRNIKRVLEEELGQWYTSDTKEEDPGTFRRFEEITYLGAHPVIVNGRYSGALKKSVLERNIGWTRTKDIQLHQVVRTFVELASQWDEAYFLWYSNAVKQALVKATAFGWEDVSYRETRMVVSQRQAEKGYKSFDCQSGRVQSGLTGLKSTHNVESHRSQLSGNVGRAVGQKSLDLKYGVNSDVVRTSYTWKSAQRPGSNVAVLKIPQDLLSLTDDCANTNIQDMPFNNYMFWRGNVRVTIQTNGSAFQQGLLLVYFYPLAAATIQMESATCCQHMFVSANSNTTASITIPFRWPRLVMKTTQIPKGGGLLGTLYIRIMGKLRGTPDEVGVTVLSAFPESEFFLPKPLAATTEQMLMHTIDQSPDIIPIIEQLEETQPEPAYNSVFQDSVDEDELDGGPKIEKKSGSVMKIERKTGDKRTRRLRDETLKEVGKFVAQGQSGSKSIISNSYNIERLVGDVSTGEINTRGNAMETDIAATASLPMDNPVVASGSVPTAPAFSGMSKVVGMEPTVGMQLNPSAMYVQGKEHFGADETDLRHLCALPGVVVAKEWKTTQKTGTVVADFLVNSIMDKDNKSGFVPFNVSLLNLATFWRADFVFDVRVIKTPFHAGRLRMVMAYGSNTVVWAHANRYPNVIMDFSGDVCEHSFTVPYNAETQFLRSYDNIAGSEVFRSYSLGRLGLFVQTPLRAGSGSVDKTVDVLVFVRVTNVVLTVPRNLHSLAWNNDACIPTLTYPTTEDDMVAQGPIEDEQPDQEVAPVGDPLTDLKVSQQSMMPPCTEDEKAKFPYAFTNVLDLVRRPIIFGKDYRYYDEGVSVNGNFAVASAKTKGFQLYVKPWFIFNQWYGGWSGSLKYRIYTKRMQLSISPILFTPANLPRKEFSTAGCLAVCGVGSGLQSKQKVGAFNVAVECIHGTMGAKEVAFPVSANEGFIDVMVPFHTHLEFLYCTGGNFNGCISQLGILSGLCDGDTDPVIYQSAADDFCYGVFRPPPGIHLKNKTNPKGLTKAIALLDTWVKAGEERAT